MIISCFANSYGRFGVQAAIARLADSGIRHLEMPIRTANVPTFFGDTPLVTEQSSASEMESVRRHIADAGLAVSSCNVTSGNPQERQVVEVTKKKLDAAAAFSVSLVVGGAGEADTNQDRGTLLEHLVEIGDHAASLGITYCFETHPGLCMHADGMLRTVSELRHAHLRLNFDTGNILYYNDGADVLESLRMVRDHVAHVHLKDTNGVYKAWHFPALGAGGAVDFAAVKQLLDEVEYDGPYSLEIEGIEGEPPLTVEQHQQRIAESIIHLQQCGFISA